MSNLETDNFVRCHQAIQLVCSASILCIQKVLEDWHGRLRASLSACTTPQTCPNKGKPRTGKNSCQACVDWANDLELAIFPPNTSGSLPWSNINPTLLHKDPVEASKIFVLRLQPGTYSDVGDFDTASLLMIMMKFSEFNKRDQSKYGIIKKVSDLRNILSHMKVNKNLELKDQATDNYFNDMRDLVTCINLTHPQYFPTDDTTKILQALTDIRTSPVTKRLTDEVLKPFSAAMEQVVRETIHDVLAVNTILSTDQGVDQCSTVSEDTFDVNTCIAELRRVYEDEKGKVSTLPFYADGLVDIDDIFVHLELEPDNTVKNSKEFNHYNDIFKLEKKSGSPVLRVLVKGGPGCGKSTLSAKIAYDWAQGEPGNSSIGLEKFQLLFALNMRLFDKDMTLVDAIFDQLIPTDSHISKDALGAYIVKHTDKVAVILDGADEFSGKIVKSRTGNLVVDVVCNKLLCDSSVVVTTRPHMVSKVKEFGQYVHVKVNGFTEASVLEFIGKFFKVSTFTSVKEVQLAHLQVRQVPKEIASRSLKESVDSFVRVIYQSSTLWSISRIPVILTMLCLLWTESRELPKRVTSIYQEAMHYFTQRWLEKEGSWYDDSDHGESTETESHILIELGQVAFSSLLEDRLFFTEKEFHSPGVLEKACSIGIVEQERKRSRLHVVKQFTFCHKTFQEFSAALYWTSLVDASKDKFLSYLRRIDSNNAGSLEYVLLFCCGLNAKAADLIISHFVEIRSDEVLVQNSCQMYLRTDQSWILGMRLLYESQCSQIVRHFKRWFICEFIEIGLPMLSNGRSDTISCLDYFMDCFKKHLSVEPEGKYSMLVPDHSDSRCRVRPGNTMRDTLILKYLSKLVVLLLEYAKAKVRLNCVFQNFSYNRGMYNLEEICIISGLVKNLRTTIFHELHLTFTDWMVPSDFAHREYKWEDSDIESAELLEKPLFELGFCIGCLDFQLCLCICRDICRTTSSPLNISPLLDGITSSPGDSTPIRGIQISDCSFITEAMVAFLAKSRLHTFAVTFTSGSTSFQTKLANRRHNQRNELARVTLSVPQILQSISSNDLVNLQFDFGDSKLSFKSSEHELERLLPGLKNLHLIHTNDSITSGFGKSLIKKIAKLDNSLQSLRLDGCVLGGLTTIPQLPLPVYLIKSEVTQYTMIQRSINGIFQWLQDAIALTDVCSALKIDHPLISALKNMPHLEYLDLSSTNLIPSDFSVLVDGLITCKHLKLLQLSNNVIGWNCVGLSQALRSLGNLTVLCLKYAQLGNSGVTTLANSFQFMRNLEALDITGNAVSFKGVYKMSLLLHHLCHLSILNLCENPIGDLGMLALCNSFQGIPKLTSLFLNDCALCSPAALLLALSFQFLPSLSRLHVAHNKQIGAKGAGWLLESIDLAKSLSEIDLQLTNLADNEWGSSMQILIEISVGEQKRILAVTTTRGSARVALSQLATFNPRVLLDGHDYLSPPIWPVFPL